MNVYMKPEDYGGDCYWFLPKEVPKMNVLEQVTETEFNKREDAYLDLNHQIIAVQDPYNLWTLYGSNKVKLGYMDLTAVPHVFYWLKQDDPPTVWYNPDIDYF